MLISVCGVWFTIGSHIFKMNMSRIKGLHFFEPGSIPAASTTSGER